MPTPSTDTQSMTTPKDGAGWRPIETAPKGKQWKRPELLLWDGRRSRVGRWDEDEYVKKPRPFWSYNGSLGKTDDRSNQPTHWMPLPAAPGTHPAPASPDAEMVKVVRAMVSAWDILPEGYYSKQEISSWILDELAPAINDLRALLSKHGGDHDK